MLSIILSRVYRPAVFHFLARNPKNRRSADCRKSRRAHVHLCKPNAELYRVVCFFRHLQGHTLVVVRGNNSFGRGEGRPPHGAGGSRGAGVVAGAAGAAAGVGDGVAAAGGVCAERSQLASNAREARLGKAKRRSLMFIIRISGATSFAGVRETTDRGIGQFANAPGKGSKHIERCVFSTFHIAGSFGCKGDLPVKFAADWRLKNRYGPDCGRSFCSLNSMTSLILTTLTTCRSSSNRSLPLASKTIFAPHPSVAPLTTSARCAHGHYRSDSRILRGEFQLRRLDVRDKTRRLLAKAA